MEEKNCRARVKICYFLYSFLISGIAKLLQSIPISIWKVGLNFKKKYQVLNFLSDDRYICSGLKKQKISIGHFFASRPSV
jgi:hypothetical protein